MRRPSVLFSMVLTAVFAVSPPVLAGDWAGWRGPGQMGASPEQALVSGWSAAGENLIWRADFVGRSTPVVFDGRVCANGRTGEGVTRQAVVACWDAGDGHLLWQREIPIYLTTVPFNRVGWGHPAADPETGTLFVPTVDGKLIAFDSQGNTVWRWDLGEDVGRFSGYGGRTHSPLVDDDQVIMGVINSSWGDQGAPRHRYFSFDKRTGEVLWVSTPGGSPFDLNTYSTPVVAEIGGQRLLIGGNADGWVYAMKVATGEKVWGFELSKRGLNTSVVVDGDTVYATHSEENVDEGTMGRVVAIDGKGTGVVTTSKELWRAP
ncbi:MAG: PQQ-binding-like beta-propeller repeat protein, partial [Acidobacteria bacterium]|nr:PQQ-binding-like beta-propeller repeat protein [Acidobacteriota bacterium]